jgi:hypothetical protein
MQGSHDRSKDLFPALFAANPFAKKPTGASKQVTSGIRTSLARTSAKHTFITPSNCKQTKPFPWTDRSPNVQTFHHQPEPDVIIKLKSKTASDAFDVAIVPITENSIDKFKSLNLSLFPVVYNQQFYTNVTALHSNLSRLAVHGHTCVAAISCRVEPIEDFDYYDGPFKALKQRGVENLTKYT